MAVTTVASAFGADLAPQYTKAPMTAAPSWTGLYLGINAGGGLQNTIIDDKDCNLSCSSLSFSKAFATVGGTAGYNYQFGAGVIGLEGDINYSSYKTSLNDPSWNAPNGSLHSNKTNWFSTIRGRFGLAVSNVMVYGTAGVALVDRNSTGSASNGGCPSDCFTIKNTSVGIAAGGGAEYMLSNNWSMKAEYLYITTGTGRAHDGNPARVQSYNQYAATDSMQVGRLGINYRFGY